MTNETVRGPYSKVEIKAQFTDGRVDQDCLVWGRAQSDWQKISLWMAEPQLAEVTEIAEATVVDTSTPDQQQWHYAIDGVSKGPFSRSELITELSGNERAGETLVWTKGMKAWADLYDFHDLVEELGFNRREHPRSPISGAIVIKLDESTVLGHLKTISPGGFGATHISSQITAGTHISVEIKSDFLDAPISGKATVQYVSESGFYGFKFTSLDVESKGRILDYIKNRAALSKAA